MRLSLRLHMPQVHVWMPYVFLLSLLSFICPLTQKLEKDITDFCQMSLYRAALIRARAWVGDGIIFLI